ncbi:response regulator transcription factor [Thermincola potens]|uniref:Stage 0 sporulation protein A homolog n=1 Tax=Thermincola potens (strain JR) TaxID=635013 RepID=D5XBU0_THEPJ|nr:response regulator [Thermincola potens]ADG81488.1 two component transcriptional regulator, AraC family [Thermincola potens JR]
MYNFMVVDDEQLERKAIQVIMERRGLPFKCVAEAGHGAEAVSKAAEQKPDLIFMDIQMPGMNGLEAAKKILETNPRCRVVFLTAYDQFEYARKGLQMGAADYLLKPVRPDILEETCRKVMESLEYERRKMTEHEQLQQELRQSRPMIQTALVYDLLYGNFYNKEGFRDKNEYLNFEFKSALVMVISIKSPNNPRPIQQACKSIKDFLADIPFAFVVPVGMDCIAFLWGHNMEQVELTLQDMKEMAYNLQQQVAQETGLDSCIGIGWVYHDFADLYKSYREACSAVNLANLLQGKNSVLHISECVRYYNNIPEYSLGAEKKLAELVLQGNCEGIGECVQELYQAIFRSCSGNLIWAKARCLQLLGVLCRVAADARADAEELVRINSNLVNELLELNQLEELKGWMQKGFAEVTMLVKKTWELSSNRVVKQVQDYVEQNLHKNITLEDICGVVYLNPQYFSRLFKKETGITFIEYLTRRRIERAKILLKEEGLSVSLTARKVGFADANYFSRVFCRLEGIPPSEYARKRP